MKECGLTDWTRWTEPLGGAVRGLVDCCQPLRQGTPHTGYYYNYNYYYYYYYYYYIYTYIFYITSIAVSLTIP